MMRGERLGKGREEGRGGKVDEEARRNAWRKEQEEKVEWKNRREELKY